MPWNEARVAQLHRRAGFGATFAQLKRDVEDGFEQSLARVIAGEKAGPGGQPAAEFTEIVTAMEESAIRRPAIERVQLLWLYRMIFTPHPLAEAMTLAWHSHYATSQAKVRSPEMMLAQNRTLRKLWNAPASELHKAMLNDGAMLRWLDGLNSSKSTPNENLSREFLELFALGEGNYTENDIREIARALTGMREIRADNVRTETFDTSDHDSGEKTIFGEKGKWGRDDVVRIVCQQSSAATRLAWRLFRTLISDTVEPSPDLLKPLADTMRTNGDVDIARGIETILRSRLFHSDECRVSRVKSPVSFTIGAIRALETFSPPPDLTDLEIELTNMGQRLFFPQNVAGWQGGTTWLRSATIVARANFAANFSNGSSENSSAHIRELATRYGFESTGIWHGALGTLLCGAPPTVRHDFANHAQAVSQLLSTPEAQIG
jgi:uncharacterized protein (DUF1800 family)